MNCQCIRAASRHIDHRWRALQSVCRTDARPPQGSLALPDFDSAGGPLSKPVFGDYRGIPPLLIQVGEHEMLRDDSVRVAKKALADGIPVKFEVWPGMVHVFQIRGLPESRESIEQIAEFMRSKLPKP